MFDYIVSMLLGWDIGFRPPYCCRGVRSESSYEAVCALLLHGSAHRKNHTVKERAQPARSCMASSRLPTRWPRCRVILLGASLKQVWTIKSL